jgi:hypothetical protein
MPSNPIPNATASQTFSPVYGSVWPLPDDDPVELVLELVGLEVLVEEVVAVGVELDDVEVGDDATEVGLDDDGCGVDDDGVEVG